MVGIRENKFSPQVLISLKGLKGLDYIETYKDGLRIGAMSTHSQLTESLLIRESFTALSDAVDHLGSLQIRNVATIGGNISNALPSADTACPLLVLNAQVKIKGPQEERKLPLEEFFMGPGKTALRSDEILIEFRKCLLEGCS
jgi:CO/xanthine dehydrogenase FAD-binding subunit